MKLIKPSYEIIEQGPGLQGIYDIIEKCGKVSYKSEPKGGETAKKFVEARTREKHGAVLEFGTVYLTFNPGDLDPYEAADPRWRYNLNKYSKVRIHDSIVYVTTNYRVLIENGWLDDLKYLTEPKMFHERRYTVKFITDIGTGREFLRHRTMSMVQESTRYVNYMKEKFGEELTFVIPPWIDIPEAENVDYLDGDWVDMNKMKIIYSDRQTKTSSWIRTMNLIENAYRALTNDWSHIEGVKEEDKAPWLAQQARTVLPLATKTEFVMCGFKDAWIHFFCLRSDIAATGKPHPQAQELANPLRDVFIEKQFITEDELKHDALALNEAAYNWGRPKKKKND